MAGGLRSSDVRGAMSLCALRGLGCKGSSWIGIWWATGPSVASVARARLTIGGPCGVCTEVEKRVACEGREGTVDLNTSVPCRMTLLIDEFTLMVEVVYIA